MKRRNWRIALVLLVTGALAGFYNACSVTHVQFQRLNGTVTGTGNPMAPVSNELLFAVCGVVSRCNSSVTFNQCSSQFLSATGVGAPLGLATSYNTLSSIMQAEESGALVGNSTLGGTCYDSINSLSCSSPLVQSAYNSSLANPFQGAVDMISGQSCGNIISPPAQYSCSSRVFLRGASNAPNILSAASAGLSYSISPPLPAGMSLDPATGTISGTPTVVTPMTQYTVSASSSLGVISTSTVSLRTADGFLVNDMGDADDAGYGDGVCKSASGTCTLRAAVDEADHDSSSKVIVVPAGTINVSSTLNVTTPMEIYGDCAGKTIVDGGGVTGVFFVDNGPTVISDMTVQNGSVAAPNSDGAGFFVNNDKGYPIFTVTLQNLTVQNNVITGTNSSAGAGICAAGWAGPLNIQVKNSVIANNGGSGVLQGGGISVGQNVQGAITNSTFSGNGGGTPLAYGGGLSFNGTSLTISNSLFTGNKGNPGSAIASKYDTQGTLTIVNSTITGNATGAALHLDSNFSTTLVNNTISSNTNPTQGGGSGAIEGSGSATVSLVNNIFSNNLSGTALANCTGTMTYTSLGHNLSDSSAADCNLKSAGDMVATASQLSVLQSNGGPTSTEALLPTSPAINNGDPAHCPSTDQRGLPRLLDGKCDIGAFEVQ